MHQTTSVPRLATRAATAHDYKKAVRIGTSRAIGGVDIVDKAWTDNVRADGTRAGGAQRASCLTSRAGAIRQSASIVLGAVPAIV